MATLAAAAHFAPTPDCLISWLTADARQSGNHPGAPANHNPPWQRPCPVENGGPERRPFVKQGVAERLHSRALPNHIQIKEPAADDTDDQGQYLFA